MNKDILIGFLIVTTLLFGFLYATKPVFLGAGSGPAHYQTESFLQGLAAGARDQFSVSNVGALTSSGANTLSGATTFSAPVYVQPSVTPTLFIGATATKGCITMGESDGSGITYITVANGVVSATTTKPDSCY